MAADRTQTLAMIAAAWDARERAYAPYSRFCVGAALLTREGCVFQGCNVENASYGLTLCAERTALGAAVAAGYRRFAAIAIASSGQTAPIPCGACLQALAEFGDPAIVARLGGEVRVVQLRDLLTAPFSGSAEVGP